MVEPMSSAAPRDLGVADAPPSNWVDRYAPASWRPFLRLSRADRPIGAWLLLLPGWWSLALAASAEGQRFPDLGLMLLFVVGALAMRGAGCTYNDIIDRDIDAKVARTAGRPLPSGAVTLERAYFWLIAQSLAGLVILLLLNGPSVRLGIGSVALVAVYPFMKRITHWPQVWLGLTFNWGALLGWTAAMGELGQPAVWLYAGAVAWTIGYDTIYAHQDKEDDAMIGVRSSALKLAGRTKFWLRVFYGAAWAGFLTAIITAGAGFFAYVGLLVVGVHFLWQIRWLDIDLPHVCLMIFKSNRDVGLIFLVGLLLGLWL
jgi:4-hydroxybenzoate polyprenyltransferase